ncbi:hypothetical protein [Trichormus variabilis]|uniref:Uncharacterized protein n=1 Tax=Trichormus variabilis SAG 1403-4b TaxID=447716 RepID=A0A433UIT9_ANAVA|nr:hypothetical protein [Trichormus variabilis]MBD2628832.1 hypothetical protein [Trichormus variabilis FACHB-164]RUS93761.1 hypothetical protein DSM107003_42620 [Trichormus variabilis SAG 1403-4b]
MLTKTQLLALADYIIGLERGVRLEPDAEQTLVLESMIPQVNQMDSLTRFQTLGYAAFNLKGNLEIEQAVNNYVEES